MTFQTRNDNFDDERSETRIPNLTNYSSNNYSTTAGILRDTYAERFMTTEAVTWQWNMI